MTDEAAPAEGVRALLVVAGRCGARPTTGVEMRRAFLVRTLAGFAETAVFVTEPVAPFEQARMAADFGVRVGSAPTAGRAGGPARVGRLLRLWPTAAAARDVGALREAFVDWVGPYDVVVVEELQDLVILRSTLNGPIVLDMDDIRSVGVLQQLRNDWSRELNTAGSRRLTLLPTPLRQAAIRGRRLPKLAWKTLAATREWAAWRRAESLVGRQCSRIIVCSDEDRSRLGRRALTTMVPNGFDLQGAPAGGDPPRGYATIAFWGPMTYGPNADGARWFVQEVMPLLRRRLPEIQVLIVGRGGDALGIGSEPGVEVTGFVTDLRSVLTRIDAVIVPLRMGVGTRIKILEAWANRLPVVSTSVGAHGLSARDGVELLIADDPTAFAVATSNVLTDPSLARALAANGLARSRDFTWQQSELALRAALTTLVQ